MQFDSLCIISWLSVEFPPILLSCRWNKMRLRISFRTFPSVFLTSSVQWAPTSNRISLCILLFGAEEIKNINSPQNSGFGHCKLQVLPRCWGQYYLGCVVVFYFVQGTENQIMKLECLSPLAFGLFVNCTSIIWSNPSLLVSPPPAWPSSRSVCLSVCISFNRAVTQQQQQPAKVQVTRLTGCNLGYVKFTTRVSVIGGWLRSVGIVSILRERERETWTRQFEFEFDQFLCPSI